MTKDTRLCVTTSTTIDYTEKTEATVLSRLTTTEQNIVLPEILFITTFPPRECGIATYSQDLINAINNQFENSFDSTICALESDTEQHQYERRPKYILNTDQKNSFTKVAFKINHDDNIKLVVMQHEFGFFSKKEDEFKTFFQEFSKPILFVFHTVLPCPGEEMRIKVQEMATIATSIVVMTKDAAHILQEEYHISEEKITVIPHGTHLVAPPEKNKLKEEYQLTGRKVLSTFGLLGYSKSIETTLDALPSIILKHPDVIFLVLGKTHPTIIKNDGEKYRNMLEAKVRELNIENHVRFVNEYLKLPVLLSYLQITDIYLFTSKDPNQAVSGTFSYAVSCGCPVISTPIPHAKEVLNHNNGILIDFESSAQLAKAANTLLDDDRLREEISSNSIHRMAPTAWQNSAVAHALLFEEITSHAFRLHFRLPSINLNHIRRLTTTFGMIQFSKIAQPDIHTGYTLDDNSRALIAICQHFEMTKNEDDIELISTYLNFIEYCQQANGKFLNYVDEKGEFTKQNKQENLDDSNGRALWALGYTYSLHRILPINIIVQAEEIFDNAMQHAIQIHSTRAMAFIIKGLHYRNASGDQQLIEVFANRLIQMYRHEKMQNWHWFENYLTYGNSLLPEALLCAYVSTGDENFKTTALESFNFLMAKIFVGGAIRVISNKGWHYKERIDENVVGGEQPIDVAYTIMALEKFYAVFKKAEYKRKAISAFNWFLGENHLHQIVYNPCTGGCYDGIEEHNVNLNQGAESTLSYLMARLAIQRMTAFENTELRRTVANQHTYIDAVYTETPPQQKTKQKTKSTMDVSF